MATHPLRFDQFVYLDVGCAFFIQRTVPGCWLVLSWNQSVRCPTHTAPSSARRTAS